MEEACGLAVQQVAMATLTASKMYSVQSSSSGTSMTVVESATMCSNAQQRQYTIRTPNDFAHAFDWQDRKLWRSQWRRYD